MIGRVCFMLAAVIGLAASAPVQAASKPAPTCETACLRKLASAFVDALVSRKWNDVPWAHRVRYTENGVGMTVGDGIWATVTAHTNAPLVVADPANDSVVWLGSIDEHGQPGYLALRIKAAGERIAEAEAVIRRKQGRPPYAEPSAYPIDPAFAQTVPSSARLPRERMIGLAQGYLNSIAANDGTLLTRLDANCVRVENGLVMTSGDAAPAELATGCEGQIKAGLFRDLDRMRGVRFPAVDEERGLIVATGVRDYSGRAATLTTTDGRTFAPDAPFPHSYVFVSVFKVRDGMIWRIEEITSDVPYLMPSWKDADD